MITRGVQKAIRKAWCWLAAGPWLSSMRARCNFLGIRQQMTNKELPCAFQTRSGTSKGGSPHLSAQYLPREVLEQRRESRRDSEALLIPR